MIIWKGLGILAAIIPIIFIITSNSILGSEVVGWAILTSAIPVWLLGRYFYKRPAQLMVDSETDQNILVKPEHTLFWVEMDYWAIILVIFGIANVLPINIREASLGIAIICLLYTSPSPRDATLSRMPSSA